jgi:hypothetical protein
MNSDFNNFTDVMSVGSYNSGFWFESSNSLRIVRADAPARFYVRGDSSSGPVYDYYLEDSYFESYYFDDDTVSNGTVIYGLTVNESDKGSIYFSTVSEVSGNLAMSYN